MDETAQPVPQEGVNNGESELKLEQSRDQEQSSAISSSNPPDGNTITQVGSGLSEAREQSIDSSSGGLQSANGTASTSSTAGSNESVSGTNELTQSELAPNWSTEESIASESTGGSAVETAVPTSNQSSFQPNQDTLSVATGPAETIQPQDVPSQISNNQSGAPFYKRLKPIHYLIGVVIALAVVASVAARPAIAPSSAPTATLNTTGCVVPSLTQKMPVASSSGTSSEHTR